MPKDAEKGSLSSQLRKRGNALYKEALLEGLPPLIKCSRLDNALQSYLDAAREASGPNALAEKSSAFKNCGMTTKRLAQHCMQQVKDDGDKEYAQCLNKFVEYLKYMSKALQSGLSQQSSEWKSRLRDEMEATYTEVFEITESFTDTKQKLRELYQVTWYLPTGIVLANAKYHIANTLFGESVRLLERENLRDCLSYLHDIHQPIEEALQILGGFSQAEVLKLDLEVLRQDALYHISTAESLQARKSGEKLLKELLNEEEFLNMDLLWDAVDWFKEACLKAAEVDLEQEAAAMSYLGYVNQKILGSNYRAKLYYQSCLTLVEAAKPKTFLIHHWYQQCVTGFKKIQDAERLRDENDQEKVRQKTLKSLKEELEAVTKADTSASSLLTHVYSNHPPSDNPKFTKADLEQLCLVKGKFYLLPTEEQKLIKKLLLKAIRDYHPDKIVYSAEDDDEQKKKKKKIFWEEITKKITTYYQEIKLG